MSRIELEAVLAEARGKLRELRAERDMGLRAWSDFLRKRAGFTVSPQTIMRQEKGDVSLDAEYVLAVQAATEVPIEWLLLDRGRRGGARELPFGVALELEAACDALFSGGAQRVGAAA